MPASSKKWLPLEANPEVMQKYVSKLGGNDDLKFSDVLSTEDWALEAIAKPHRALLLLFPLNKDMEAAAVEQAARVVKDGQEVSKNLWFMKQTIDNACGTIGLLHAINNIPKAVPFKPGMFFDSYFEQVKNMTPDERAKALEESPDMEKAHADAEKQGQSHVPTENEKVDTHFITFVEVDGSLYELDGRKKFPINHGASTKDTFLSDAVKIIKKHFIEKNPTELRFSMIAISGGK